MKEHELEEKTAAVDLAAVRSGPLSSEVVVALVELGHCQLDADQPEPALGSFMRALEIADMGAVHTDSVRGMLMGNIGLALRQTNRLGEAETWLRKSIALLTRSLGPDDLATGRSLGDLGAMMLDLSRNDPTNLSGAVQAAMYLAQALEVFRRVALGDDESLIAQTLFGLGLAHVWTGDLDTATIEFKEARDLFLISGAEGALNVAECDAMLGSIEIIRGDLRPAQLLLERALESMRRDPEVELQTIANTMGNLALALAAQGNLQPARRLQAEATILWDASQEIL